MVDIAITPASVVAGTNATKVSGIAGATILAGQLVYKDEATQKYLLCDTNAVDTAARRPAGVALHGASLNQPLTLATSGDVTIGGTLVAGTDYFASDTPGGLCPKADVGTGEAVAFIGLARSTSVIAIDIQFPGVVL